MLIGTTTARFEKTKRNMGLIDGKQVPVNRELDHGFCNPMAK